MQSESHIHICHITSLHPRNDSRIFTKQCLSIALNNKHNNNHNKSLVSDNRANYKVSLIVADNLPNEVMNVECDGQYSSITIYNVHDAGAKQIIKAPNFVSNRLLRAITTSKLIYQQVMQLTPKPHIIHVHDPELLFLALRLARLEYKVVYDSHEDLPKQILNKYWIPKLLRGAIAFMARATEHFISKRLAAIVTATPIIADRFKSIMPKQKPVIAVCNYPISAQYQTIHNASQTTIAVTSIVSNHQYNDNDWQNRENSLCYIGSISKTRGIEQLINSLAISKLRLKLAGIFSGDTSLKQLSSLEGFCYVDYLGVLTHNKIKQLLSQVKIGIVTLLPTPSYKEALPIKLFEYMQAGIPVVASNFPLYDDIIKKSQCGLTVNPLSANDIASACLYLLQHQNIAKQMGQNGANAVASQYCWQHEANKLLELYNALLDGAAI